MEVTAVGIEGNIQITDDDDLLSKNDDIIVKIINNTTGKTVYTDEEAYGIFSIPLNIYTLLPNTEYTILASANYIIDGTSYTKNFLYKTFVTSQIGVEIEKNAFTDTTLSFDINFTDSLVQSLDVKLLDTAGEELANRVESVRNTGDGIQEVTFDGLTSNTSYKVKVTNIVYDTVIQEGENWEINYECQTLKTKPTIDKLNYSVNKRDGTATMYIDSITDDDSAIINYTYIVYEYKQVATEDGYLTLAYDTDNVTYQRETTNKEITVTVADDSTNEPIVRGKYYGFKIIAETYDNEKYVEIESNICGAFVLNGSTFPTVKFEKADSTYSATEIEGWLYIIDNENTITVDEDNPLTITYYSDVIEGNIYVKKTGITDTERVTDTSGNECIRIWVDIGAKGSSKAGLQADTSYTFTVYGTVDLKDGNDPYKNVHIGSAIVTTDTYKELTAKLVTRDVSQNTFTVDFSLSGSDVSAESLKSLNILVYEGSGEIGVGEYKYWKRTITTNNYALALTNAKYQDREINSLQDLLFDNELVITPSFVGGGSESNYNELYYRVVITATVDGTSYSNKIPITTGDDGDEMTGDTMYADVDTLQEYTAAYIVVLGDDTVPVPTKDYKNTFEFISNGSSGTMGMSKLAADDDLNSGTTVGVKVSTEFKNTGSSTAKQITYYVWDINGNPVYDGNGEQLKKVQPITNPEVMPSVVFDVGYGTLDDLEEDNKTGMHRGGAYFFSFTITYITAEGDEKEWPMCESTDEETYTEQSQKTDVAYPKKQEANFVLYPKTSDDNTITYIYSCKDIDSALYYDDYSTMDYSYLYLLVDDAEQGTQIEINTDGVTDEVVIGKLSPNVTYTIACKEKINKLDKKAYSNRSLVTQKFEGIIECNAQISKVIYDYETNPNEARIVLTGSNLQRIAAAKVTLVQGNNTIESDLLKLNTDNGTYIKLNMLDLIEDSNFENFLGKDAEVKVTVYYDNGKIGFVPENPTGYAAYVRNSSATRYLSLNNGKLEVDDVKNDSINGKMFKYDFTAVKGFAYLGLKDLDAINNNSNGKTLFLTYSDAGLKDTDYSAIVVQKEIALKELEAPDTINIKKLRLGVKINKITETLSTANVEGTITNPLNLDVSQIVVEIFHSKNENDKPDWDSSITQTISIDEFDNFMLEGLVPAEYYSIRFKYKENGESTYVYTYDTDTNEVGRVYKFSTLTTIGITNLKIEYSAENYINKYINFSYEVDEEKSNMYELTRYTFYESDGKTKVNLTDKNIIINNENANYKIEGGTLVVENSYYQTDDTFKKVEEQIAISPANNVFTMGKDYILTITPIVTGTISGDCEIEDVSKQFTLDALTNPYIGLKMTRNQTADSSEYIKVAVSISDKDGVIYGPDYGTYELHVYRYKDNDVRSEVPIYSYYELGTGDDLTGQTFNLKDNAVNFITYVQKVDYTYNYCVEVTMKYDKDNKGITSYEDDVTHVERYILSAIDNNSGVSIGSSTIVQNNNKCEIRFYDSYYNITKINSITYTVFDLTNNYIKTGTYTPTWSQVSDNDITYYKISLPNEFDTDGTYSVQLNLYVDNELINQVNSTFIYNKANATKITN
jgi:hypothetical protein